MTGGGCAPSAERQWIGPGTSRGDPIRELTRAALGVTNVLNIHAVWPEHPAHRGVSRTMVTFPMSRSMFIRAGSAMRTAALILAVCASRFTAAEGARLDGSMAFTVVEVEMPETLDKLWEFSIKGGNDGDQYVANTKVIEENEGVRKGDKVRSRPQATLQLRNSRKLIKNRPFLAMSPTEEGTPTPTLTRHPAPSQPPRSSCPSTCRKETITWS